MKNIARAALALMGTIAAAAASAGTIETALGPVTIDGVPKTIAVFDMPALDTLLALGVPVAGVPSKVYLPALEAATEGAETVGTLFEPDLEALNALGPDLIIIGGRSAAKRDDTSRVGTTIDMSIDGTRVIEDARQRIRDYGTLFGKETEAAALEATLDANLEAAKTAAAGKGTALVLMTNGPKIAIYGPASRFGWIYDALDMPPAVNDLDASTHGDAINFEFIAKADPDWIFVLDRAAAIGSGEASAKATLDNALVRATKAWRAGNIIYLPAAEFYIADGGATATGKILKSLTEGLGNAE